jgi:SAM-dependent methyltransferase
MDRLLEATARAERDHFWFRGFRAFVTPLLEAAAGESRPLRLLDIGCGTGHNLSTLLRRYGHAVGVDLTWRGLAYAREGGLSGLTRATAANLPFAEDRFDVVTSFDVLQCLPDGDERRAVAEMVRVLRPGGHAVITVAAMDLLWGDHSILAHEVRRYSRPQLDWLIRSAGFEVRRLTYTNASLVPVLLAGRYLQRRRGLVASDEDEAAAREIAVPTPLVNVPLSGVLAVEAALARHINLPFGSSLLCLASKPALEVPAVEIPGA